MSLLTLVPLRINKSYSHFSIGSLLEYLIGSINSISLRILSPDILTLVSPVLNLFYSRNLLSSFNDNDLPVPSYPLIVLDRNTK